MTSCKIKKKISWEKKKSPQKFSDNWCKQHQSYMLKRHWLRTEKWKEEEKNKTMKTTEKRKGHVSIVGEWRLPLEKQRGTYDRSKFASTLELGSLSPYYYYFSTLTHQIPPYIPHFLLLVCPLSFIFALENNFVRIFFFIFFS